MKTNFKKSVSKKLSRILSAATAALMLAVSIPQASLAAIPTDNVINNLNGKNYDVNSTNYTEIGIGSTYSATGVIVDFDFTIPNLDDTYELMPRTYRGGGTSDTHVWFNKGKICIEQVEGTTWYGNDEKIVTNPGGNTNSEASYQANQTRHMTMVYDENGNPNGAAGEKFTIDYYIDGEYVCTLNTPLQVKNSTVNKLQKMFFRARKITEGTQMTVSNFTVRDANKYPNLEYDTPVVNEDGVSVKFSETLACANTENYTSGNDLSNIKIKSIDGQEVSGVSASIKNDTLTVSYTGSLLPGMTYYVVLPKNFKSVDEKILADNAIAFTAPQTENAGVDATVYSEDFESATSASYPTGLGYSSVDKKFENVGDTNNKAWHLDGTDTNIKYVRCLAVNDAQYDLSDEIVVSADFYLNELKRTADIMLQNASKNKKFGFCFFDAAGHFVVLKKDGWSTSESVLATDDKNLVAKTQIMAKKWYTVKMVLNKTNRTISYYLGYDNNGEMAWENVGTVPFLQGETTDKFDEFRLQGWENKSAGTRPYGDFYLDNIKIWYQNINITPANIIATSENTITYNFSADENKLNDKYVLDANVKFVEAGKPIYFRCNDNKNSNSGLLFCADADGNLSMSKSLLNWKNDAFMRDLGVKSELNKLVNIKLLVDKTRTKPVTVFINNKYVRSLALGWGSEPNNADYLIDNPGAANFIKGDGNTSPNTVDSVSIGNMTANVPESITLTDSANKIYSIYTDGIPADIGSVSLNYANAFADSTDVSGATLNKKGEDGALTVVSGYAAALSTDKKSIVISKTDGVLENGTYTISVIGVTGADNFTTDFVVNDTRGFVINSFSVAKDEDKYYPSITATNYGVSQKSITVLICEYTKDAIPQLVNADVKPITLNGGASTTIGKNDISLTTTRTDTTIKAFIWSALGENKPIVNAQTYTAPVTE